LFKGLARSLGAELAAECEAAGATWWIEAVNRLEESLVEFRERRHVGSGPR
jgi:hypothetical protein